MSLPFKLFRLQQLDTQLEHSKVKLSQIEIVLGDNTDSSQINDQMETAKERLFLVRKKLILAEDAVKQQRIKIDISEASLYGGKIKNPKELQDLQNEITSLKRHLQILEDRQLDAMVVLDEEEISNKQIEEFCKRELEKISISNNLDLDEQKRLLSEITHLQSERLATTNTITKNDLDLYESLRRQKKGIAVVKVSNRSCSACGSTLNATLFQAASLPNQISRCETCGRILYSGV